MTLEEKGKGTLKRKRQGMKQGGDGEGKGNENKAEVNGKEKKILHPT